ncbi:MAG: hypothetical protein ACE5H3_01690 [Planctomycetota bacterium]
MKALLLGLAVLAGGWGAPGCSREESGSGPVVHKTPSEDAPLATEVDRGPVHVRIAFSPASPRLSDLPALTLDVLADPAVAVGEIPFGDRIPGFLVRDFERELPRREGDRVLRRTVYTLEPVSSGTFVLDPIRVTFRDSRPAGDGKEHSVETEPLKVTVQTVVAEDVVSLDLLHPPAEPVSLPAPPSALTSWALPSGGLVLLVVIVLLLRRFRRRPARELRLSPFERAMHALEELAGSGKGLSGEAKVFYVELTGIVRRFLEDVTGIRAAEQTTEEFLAAIRQHPSFDTEWRRELGEFLEAADLVKFAGKVPDRASLQNSLERARKFLRKGAAEPAQEERGGLAA